VTVFLLIRHAVTDATGKRLSGSAPGIHLSARGEEQAARLAERVRPVGPAALYASPLERCIETARPIAAACGLDVLRVPALREVEYGQWTGRSIAQLVRTSLWKRVHQHPSAVRFPGGESLAEVQRRSVEALEGIAARHGSKTVAVVTHADVIRLALAHYAGVHLDLFQRMVVSPASVSVVALGDGLPRIVRMNDIGSLADLEPRRKGQRGSRNGRA
jgi:probable phosphomutase (TIGR03848 family)